MTAINENGGPLGAFNFVSFHTDKNSVEFSGFVNFNDDLNDIRSIEKIILNAKPNRMNVTGPMQTTLKDNDVLIAREKGSSQNSITYRFGSKKCYGNKD